MLTLLGTTLCYNPFVLLAAFTPRRTRAVAGFAFTAHAILAFRLMLSALPGLYDARTANAVAMFLGAVPYLVAVFAPSGATRGLFWAAIGCQLGRSLMYSEFLKFTHVRKAHVRIPAVDVHSLAERYGLITLITFGETFVSTLVEGNRVFQENEARDPVIALSVAAAVLIVYSVHGFYFDIDGRLTREDTHALHRGRFHGVMWTLLHYPLHVGLILAESALGIMVEVVGEVDHNKADDAGEALERVLLSIASRSSEAGEAAERLGYPTRNQVWLLCGSWGLALSSLVLISLMHDKKRRLRAPQLLGIATRCVVAVLMYTAVPLLCVDKLKALPLVFVVCGLLGGAFLLEFTAITFDDHARLKAASSAPRNGEETSNADVRDEEDEPPSATGIDDAAHEAADEAADKVADEANRRRHQHDRHGGPFSTGMHTAMSGLPHRGRRVVHTKSPFRGFSLY